MEIQRLSATAIRDFLQCALKLVFRFNRDLPPIKNDFANMGIAVHEALEQFTRRMMSKKSFPDASDYEFAVEVFMNSSTDCGLQGMDFYTEGKQIVTDFVDRYDPSEEIIDVENFFKLETPEGIPIIGAIDKVVKLNDDTIAIIDYKTARNTINNFELNNDIQLSMYDLAASIMWPEFKNRLLFLDYVRLNKQVSTYRTEEQREDFRKFLKSVWLQINKMDEKDFKGRINRLCGWCDYKESCPTYGEFITSREAVLTELTDMSDGEFLEHWKNVADKKAILDARQRELKMIATERFRLGQNVATEGKELYSTQAVRTNYNIEEVVKVVPQKDLLEVLSVNKARLDKYVRERPEFKTPLERIAQISYNAPVYKIRETEIEYGIPNADENAA